MRGEGGEGEGERGRGEGSKMHACSLLSVQLFTPVIWYAVAVSLLHLKIVEGRVYFGVIQTVDS